MTNQTARAETTIPSQIEGEAASCQTIEECDEMIQTWTWWMENEVPQVEDKDSRENQEEDCRGEIADYNDRKKEIWNQQESA